MQVSVTFKNQVVLKNASWEVKKGERVGLVGVNGSGKTTQLQVRVLRCAALCRDPCPSAWYLGRMVQASASVE